MSSLPKATRPLEFVAFLTVEVRTGEGNAHILLAVDAYLDHVFNLGVSGDKNAETILKAIYFLIEDPEFSRHLTGEGFTLVLEEFRELESRIQAVVAPAGGKLLYNKTYNNVISNPVLASLRDELFKRK